MLEPFRCFLCGTCFPSHGPALTSTGDNTTAYFGFEKELGPGISVAIYADRESKAATGEPCCHIEWRISGAKALRDANLRTPSQILSLNHTALWCRVLRLVETPTREAVGALWLKGFTSRHSKLAKWFPFRGRSESLRRVPTVFLRPHLGDDGKVMSNNDLAVSLHRQHKSFPGQSIGSLFGSAPNDWLLPPAGNALWDLQLPTKSTA
jgi:hypothetical protein